MDDTALGSRQGLICNHKISVTDSGMSGTYSLLHWILDLTNIATPPPRFSRSFRNKFVPFLSSSSFTFQPTQSTYSRQHYSNQCSPTRSRLSFRQNEYDVDRQWRRNDSYTKAVRERPRFEWKKERIDLAVVGREKLGQPHSIRVDVWISAVHGVQEFKIEAHEIDKTILNIPDLDRKWLQFLLK
jgi:hypothetical protein